MNDTQHRSIDRSDPRWYDAAGLAGVTFGVSVENLLLNPGITQLTATVGLLFIFVVILHGLKPNNNE